MSDDAAPLPAPPVTSDCDIRGMLFMPLDVQRLRDSHLFITASGEEFKAAVALWCKSWSQVPAASLPDDDRILADYSCAGARWPKVKAMALHGWVRCSDGRLYHAVVAEKAAEAWAKRQEQRERSRRGNASRWGSPDDPRRIPQGSRRESLGDGVGDPPRDRGGDPKVSKGTGKGERERQGAGKGQAAALSLLGSLFLDSKPVPLAEWVALARLDAGCTSNREILAFIEWAVLAARKERTVEYARHCLSEAACWQREVRARRGFADPPASGSTGAAGAA